MVVAAMYRPSGDHRGEMSPSEPGRTEAARVLMSNTYMLVIVPEFFLGSEPVNTIELPLGDQPGSVCRRSPGSISMRLPPEAEII